MKNIKKSHLIIGAILLLIIGALIFMLLNSNGIFGSENSTEPEDAPVDTESYLTRLKHEGNTQTPVFQSDIEDIFYTVSKNGDVVFYKYENFALSEVEASGSYEITVTCSRQKIPATVYYYKDENAITGYGLFTSENSDAQVLHYEYAFFRLLNLPSSHAKANTYLLLVDTNKDNFFMNDKIFDEPFEYNISTGATKKLLFDANRGIDERGAYRVGYHMLTTDVIKDAKQYIYFFSTRHYHISGEGRKLDIFRSGYAGRNNQDNARRALEVADYYCKSNDDGSAFYFLKNTEEGFNLMLNTKLYSEDDEVVHSFSGNYDEDYLRFGKYLIEKASFKITNLESLEESTLSINAPENFDADLFVVNEETGKVFMRGISNNNAAIVLADMNTGSGEIHYNERFLYAINPLPSTDGSFLVSIANDAENTSYKYVVFA